MAALKLADDAQDYDDASDSGNACAASGSEGLDGGSNSYSNIDSADSDHDGASTTESTQNDAMENKVSDCERPFHLLALPTELWIKIGRLVVIRERQIVLERAMDPRRTWEATRLRIYAMLESEPEHSDLRERLHKEDVRLYNDATRQPAITKTCRALRNELLSVYYYENAFLVIIGPGGFPLLRWLNGIGDENRQKANITIRQYDCLILCALYKCTGRPRPRLTADDQHLERSFQTQYEGYASKIKVKLGKVSAINHSSSEGISYWEARLITLDS